MSKIMNDILLRSGGINKQDYLNEMKKDEDSFVCNMCGKSFKNKKEYDMHKDGRNSKKSYYCKAMKEDIEDSEMLEEEETDGGSESDGGDEVSKLKEKIKELKAEIKELKGGKKKKKKDKKEDKKEDDDKDESDDDKDYDGDGDSSAADADDDKMAKLRAMKKKS